MTEQEGGVRPAVDRPAAETTVTRGEEKLLSAAARVLARHHHPDWRPSTEDLDGYGHGYGDGVRQHLREVHANV